MKTYMEVISTSITHLYTVRLQKRPIQPVIWGRYEHFQDARNTISKPIFRGGVTTE